MQSTDSGSGDRPTLAPRQRILVRAALLAGATLLLAVGAFVLAVVPPTDISFYPKCFSYQFLGIHCPGCGLTRAGHSLLNGHFAQALAYNPLFVLISPYLLLAAIRSTWFWLWGTKAKRSLFPARYSWLILTVFLAYWVLRNIPVYPFTLLAPHEISY